MIKRSLLKNATSCALTTSFCSSNICKLQPIPTVRSYSSSFLVSLPLENLFTTRQLTEVKELREAYDSNQEKRNLEGFENARIRLAKAFYSKNYFDACHKLLIQNVNGAEMEDGDSQAKDPEYWKLLGLCKQKLSGKSGMNRQDLKRKTHLLCYEKAGDLYVQENKFVEATKILTDILEQDSTNDKAFQQLLLVYMKQGNWEGTTRLLMTKFTTITKLQAQIEGLLKLNQLLLTSNKQSSRPENANIVYNKLMEFFFTEDTRYTAAYTLNTNTGLGKKKLILGEEECEMISKILHLKPARKLYLDECEISFKGMQMIAKEIVDAHVSGGTSLEEITFSDSDPDLPTLEVILDTINQVSTVKYVDLSRCELTGESLRLVVQKLSNNNHLERINLFKNLITDQDAVVLAELIRNNRSLKDIILADNEIGDEGMKVLMESLARNTSLKFFDVRNNERITDACAPNALEALKSNHTLYKLLLTGTSVTTIDHQQDPRIDFDEEGH